MTAHPTADHLTYRVDGMTCGHCERAVITEVGAVDGVSEVRVDLDTKRVDVYGAGVDAGAVVAAIDEAGYEAVPA